MKPAKPKIEPRYITSAGAEVKTIDEWKSAEVAHLLADAKPVREGDDTFIQDFIAANSEEFIAILKVKERAKRSVKAKAVEKPASKKKTAKAAAEPADVQ